MAYVRSFKRKGGGGRRRKSATRYISNVYGTVWKIKKLVLYIFCFNKYKTI